MLRGGSNAGVGKSIVEFAHAAMAIAKRGVARAAPREGAPRRSNFIQRCTIARLTRASPASLAAYCAVCTLVCVLDRAFDLRVGQRI
jgi:hypothetical protein